MIPAYLIGGPKDCEKMKTFRGIQTLRFPQEAVPSAMLSMDGDQPIPLEAKDHHYRVVRHELADQFAIYYYEGTW